MGTAWRSRRTRGSGGDGGGRRRRALRAGKDDDGQQAKISIGEAESEGREDAGVSGGAFRDRPPPSPEARASDRLPATFHLGFNHLAALISSLANHSAHRANSRHLIPHLILSRAFTRDPARSGRSHPRSPISVPSSSAPSSRSRATPERSPPRQARDQSRPRRLRACPRTQLSARDAFVVCQNARTSSSHPLAAAEAAHDRLFSSPRPRNGQATAQPAHSSHVSSQTRIPSPPPLSPFRPRRRTTTTCGPRKVPSGGIFVPGPGRCAPMQESRERSYAQRLQSLLRLSRLLRRKNVPEACSATRRPAPPSVHTDAFHISESSDYPHSCPPAFPSVLRGLNVDATRPRAGTAAP